MGANARSTSASVDAGGSLLAKGGAAAEELDLPDHLGVPEADAAVREVHSLVRVALEQTFDHRIGSTRR